MKYTEVNIFLKGHNSAHQYHEDECKSIYDFAVERGFVSVTMAEELSDEHGEFIEYKTTSYAAENVSSYNCVRQVDIGEMTKDHTDYSYPQVKEVDTDVVSQPKETSSSDIVLRSILVLGFLAFIITLVLQHVF